jgi:hypothetical protein
VALASVLRAEGPTCPPGQDTPLELLLRGGGGGAARGGGQVRLYTDAARGCAVLLPGGASGSGLVALAPGGGPHRLALALRPRAPGPRRETLLVHAIAPDGALLCAWRVGVHIPAPHVTRVYDVAVAGSSSSARAGAGAGARPTRKRLEYANEWAAARRVSLVSSAPEVVGVVGGGGYVALPARGRGVVRLAVAPAPPGAQADVHIYVRDESGAVEETLLLRLAWT